MRMILRRIKLRLLYNARPLVKTTFVSKQQMDESMCVMGWDESVSRSVSTRRCAYCMEPVEGFLAAGHVCPKGTTLTPFTFLNTGASTRLGQGHVDGECEQCPGSTLWPPCLYQRTAPNRDDTSPAFGVCTSRDTFLAMQDVIGQARADLAEYHSDAMKGFLDRLREITRREILGDLYEGDAA